MLAMLALFSAPVAIWGSSLVCKVACCGRPTARVCLDIVFWYCDERYIYIMSVLSWLVCRLWSASTSLLTTSTLFTRYHLRLGFMTLFYSDLKF